MASVKRFEPSDLHSLAATPLDSLFLGTVSAEDINAAHVSEGTCEVVDIPFLRILLNHCG